MVWVFRGVLALLGLVVAGLGLAIWQMNGLAADAVEDQGTAALGVHTTIDFISIGFLPPSLRVSGLEIENPEGFKDDNFLELGTGSLDVVFASLLGPEVRARSLQLDDIDVSLERGARRSNYGTILDHVKARSASKPPETGDGAGRRFRIDEIVLHNVRASLVMSVPGHPATFEVTLPEVRLEGVGTGNEGPVLAGEVFKRIALGVLEALSRQGALPREMASDLTGALAGLPRFGVDVTGDVVRGGAGLLLDGAKETGRVVEDVAGTAAGGVKKLIPGD